jgi:gas vesicle protein
MSDYREETDEQKDQSANSVAWFVTGALIGATVAVLYAPKSGKDTRKFIADRAQQGKEAVESASDNIVDTSKEMFDRGRKLVEDAAELFERGRKLVRG